MSPKVALITGASRGVGAAVAHALAADGDTSIILNYGSNPEPAERLIQELNALRDNDTLSTESPRFQALKADMADRADIRRLVNQTVQEMGRLDIVVSNVGWTRMTDFANLDEADDEADWDRCFNMNVKSHFFLFQECKKYLEKTQGAFIATASVAGVKPSGSSLPYAVTKAALIHLAKSLAAIAAPNIRVNTVSPGVLLTDWGLQFPEEKLNAVREKNVLKRFATPEDVAEQVKFLANSKSITGMNVVIDAGFSL
ncbi:hypothetical protein BDV36DRAFT_292186 [Aspergillus pseudocaelatus]|uniref:Short-chain dehydrogenase n=1 Tax=Aspergillus pseudocaelatus TaxID=1825620 RepID=A0ABQ6WWS5_9EURO|nr:hypothetical protein BDV36DRAFT_292186 [Aspergillus pseudocaelatus]